MLSSPCRHASPVCFRSAVRRFLRGWWRVCWRSAFFSRGGVAAASAEFPCVGPPGAPRGGDEVPGGTHHGPRVVPRVGGCGPGAWVVAPPSREPSPGVRPVSLSPLFAWGEGGMEFLAVGAGQGAVSSAGPSPSASPRRCPAFAVVRCRRGVVVLG